MNDIYHLSLKLLEQKKNKCYKNLGSHAASCCLECPLCAGRLALHSSLSAWTASVQLTAQFTTAFWENARKSLQHTKFNTGSEHPGHQAPNCLAIGNSDTCGYSSCLGIPFILEVPGLFCLWGSHPDSKPDSAPWEHPKPFCSLLISSGDARVSSSSLRPSVRDFFPVQQLTGYTENSCGCQKPKCQAKLLNPSEIFILNGCWALLIKMKACLQVIEKFTTPVATATCF